MESIVYQRIKELCEKSGISIAKLESTLGFGSSSIRKWENTSSPSIYKVEAVANFFHVSVDYLLGRTDIEAPISEVIDDADIISLQRARQRMQPTDRDRMMQMIKLGFAYAFEEEDDDSEND